MLLTLAAAMGLWRFVAARSLSLAIENISSDLITINQYKTEQITAWRDNHYRDAVLLSLHPFFGGLISEEISHPGLKRAELQTWLNDRLIQKRDVSLAFLSPKGAVIAATSGYPAGVEKDFKEAFAQASKKDMPLMTDLYLAADGRPRITMLSPISAAGRLGGKTLCVLVINIDPEAEFYPLLKAAPMFYKTAETLLVRKDGENVLYLNELEYIKNSALKLEHPLSDTRLPAAKAIREGYSGYFEGVDYRGVPVFSAIGLVKGTNWAVITKIDRAVILAPIKTREYLQLLVILILAGLIYAVFYSIQSSKDRAGRKMIQESEERYRRLFEAARDGIILLDFETGKITGVNPFLVEKLGYSKEVFLDKYIWEVGFFKDVASSKEAFQQLKALDYIRYEDLPLETKNGKIMEVEFVSNVYEAGGKKVIQCNIRDITERRKAETYGEMRQEVLRILNVPEELQNLIPQVLAALKKGTGLDAVGIRLQDGDDFPYFSQDGFSKDFMRTENTLVGRETNGNVIRDKDGKAKLECTCGLVISGQTDPSSPLFTRGGSFWTNDSMPLLDLPAGEDPRYHPRNQCMYHGYTSMALVPIRNEKEIIGLLHLDDRRKGCFTLNIIEFLENIAMDIGGALMRKRAEEALKEAADVKSKFASMVSHELRSPLTTILMGVSFVLEEPGGLSENNKTLLNLVHENTERLGRLITNVLDFQKIGAGKMTFDILENDINGVVQTTAQSMRLQAKDKGLELIVDMSGGPHRAMFDKDKITQVLTNLLGNAIAHTEKGVITINAALENDMLHVAVRDTGQGIKAKDLGKLFQPFEQLDSGKGRKIGGTGLGLAISKEIILAHNGKIWVESEPDKGSVFHFTLPIAKGGT